MSQKRQKLWSFLKHNWL